MKETFERLFNLIKGNKTIILTILVTLFVMTLYLLKSGDDELSLFVESLGILVVFFCVFAIIIIIPLTITIIFLAGLLIYKVIQHAFDKSGSRIPLLLLIGGTVLAVMLPPLPLAEEASFIIYRKDYEHIVTLAKANQLEHGADCRAAFELPPGYKHLSENCIFVYDYAGNINIEFSPYNYAFALNYFENPDDITKSRDCDFRGFVWKKINENWYVCKLSHTW
jgi:hypothetical protein